jgi:hypothetical protein
MKNSFFSFFAGWQKKMKRFSPVEAPEADTMHHAMLSRRKFLSCSLGMLKLLVVATPIASLFCLRPANGQTASQDTPDGKIPVEVHGYKQTTEGIAASAAGVYEQQGREISKDQKRKMNTEVERGMRDLLDAKGYEAPAPPMNLRIIQ